MEYFGSFIGKVVRLSNKHSNIIFLVQNKYLIENINLQCFKNRLRLPDERLCIPNRVFEILFHIEYIVGSSTSLDNYVFT